MLEIAITPIVGFALGYGVREGHSVETTHHEGGVAPSEVRPEAEEDWGLKRW
jgi:hypothetical protein